MRILLATAFVLTARGASLAQPRRPAACYRYDSDSVALAGRVVRRIYPGRPNYESLKAGDEPDTVFVLQLATPLCTSANPDHQARTGVREVQLYFSAADAVAIRKLRGTSTTMHGTLTGAVWGHHHLPIILHVRLPRVRSRAHAV